MLRVPTALFKQKFNYKKVISSHQIKLNLLIASINPCVYLNLANSKYYQK